MSLRIAAGFTLPLDAATQTFGILAKRRVGKTYTASVVAEEMAKANIPFVVLDPTGAWWGLRSSADGKKPGIPVVILGGEHGDVPLERGGGAVAADLVVDFPGFYVLDLVGFESGAAQDAFVTGFLERLYRRKAQTPTPLHIFIDEADSFAPQRPGRDQLKMLGAVEAIVRRGGIRGIGTTLISQRAAVVNKNVLTQLDCLIALQVTGPQDQKAIREWVAQDGTPEQVKAMMDSLASLDRGEAWVWSPGWLGAFQLIKVRERRTFNSSATPEVGKTAIVPVKLADVDLEAVRSRMAATIEKQAADDPKKLRARIAELEREYRQLAIAKADALPERVEVPVEVRVEVPVPALTDADREMLRRTAAELTAAVERINKALTANTGPIVKALRDFSASVPVQSSAAAMAIDAAKPRPTTPVIAPRPDLEVDAPLKAGARRMLDVMARQHPFVLTRAQLATLTGIKVTGGTYGTYLSNLRAKGLVTVEGQRLHITEAGLAEAGVEPGNPMTADEVREEWRGRLKAGERAMFDALAAAYPYGLSRDALADAVGIVVTGGTFGTYLSKLRSNGLAVVEGGIVTMTDTGMGVNA